MNPVIRNLAVFALLLIGFIAGFRMRRGPPPPDENLRRQYDRLDDQWGDAVQENESLRQRIAALELENDRLTGRRKDEFKDTTDGELKGAYATLHRGSALAALRELVSRGHAADAVAALARGFAGGDFRKLDLLNFLAEQGHEDLIPIGLNNRELPDAFRNVLVEAITNLDEKLAVLNELDLETEPNQGFSAHLAWILIGEVDRGKEGPAFEVIEKLLAGNGMQGNKVNLYASLGQMAGRGDPRAGTWVQDHLKTAGDTILSPSLKVLADPPKLGEDGGPMKGALLFHIQYNKGKWGSRPRQLKMGEIVTRIGDDPVTDRQSFYSAIDRNKAASHDGHVKVRVLIPDPAKPSTYRAETREMDPGDFRLMYGVFSIG